MYEIRILPRRMLQLALVAALALVALVLPGVTQAQASTTQCANLPVPAGDVVTAATQTSACQGYLLYTISAPANGTVICAVGTAYVPFPAGFVVTAGTNTGQPQCANEYETQTIYQPYNGIVACLGSTPPAPYVITAVSSGGTSACGTQSITLYQQSPGITACMNTPLYNNYQPTSVGTGGACAAYGTEVLYPVNSTSVFCGGGYGAPAAWVITRVYGSYGACGSYEGLMYTQPYVGLTACSNSTLPAGWHVTAYTNDSLCSPFEGETLAD